MTRLLYVALAMTLLAMLLAVGGCQPCAMYCGDVYQLQGADGRVWQAQYIVADNDSWYRVQGEAEGEIYRIETADMDAAVRQGTVAILQPATQPTGAKP